MNYCKSIIGFLAIIFCSTQLYATAPVSQTMSGVINLSDVTYGDLKVLGTLEADTLQANSLDVTGTLEAKHLKVANGVVSLGPADLEKIEVGSLNVNGHLNLDKAMIKNKLTVQGDAEIESVEVKDVDVKGTLKADKIKVSGDFVIIGAFEAEDSNFNNIVATSNEVILEDVNATSIFIKQDKAFGKQKLILKGKTVISGTITFEKPGVVEVKSKKVSIGNVENAEVKQ